MSLSRFGVSLVAAFTALAPTAAQAEVTYTEDNIAQCANSGNAIATRGGMSTEFGNQFWSRMACGQWEDATKLLAKAPKVDQSEALPAITDKSEFAQCFFDNFAYGRDYHQVKLDVLADEPDTYKVSHGFFGIEAGKFDQIGRAVAQACKNELNM